MLRNDLGALGLYYACYARWFDKNGQDVTPTMLKTARMTYFAPVSDQGCHISIKLERPDQFDCALSWVGLVSI
jgi:hypothetical protein